MGLKTLSLSNYLSPFYHFVPSTALVIIWPFPANIFPNKLAPNVPNKIPRNSPLYSFDSFLIVLVTPFIKKPDSSFSICSFEIINVAVTEPRLLPWIPASAADAGAGNSIGI